MSGTAIKFIAGLLVGGTAGGAGGFYIGKKLERISNMYTLEDVKNIKQDEYEWIEESEIFPECTNEEIRRLFSKCSELGCSTDTEEAMRLRNELDVMLEGIAARIDKEADDIIDNDNEVKTDDRSTDENNGKEDDKTESEVSEETNTEETISEHEESTVESQETVQVDDSSEVDKEQPEEVDDNKDDDKLIEIEKLSSSIISVIGNSISKDLIDRYTGYVAYLKNNNVDKYYSVLTDISTCVKFKDEKAMVQLIYDYVNGQKRRNQKRK